MARYLSEREEQVEIKYLQKIWSQIEDDVVMPQSLRADALLPRLEGVKQLDPENKTLRIRFSPKIFTWQSGLTYAAAFLLIFILSYTLGRETPELIDGAIAIEDEHSYEVVDETRGLLPEVPPAVVSDQEMQQQAPIPSSSILSQDPEQGEAQQPSQQPEAFALQSQGEVEQPPEQPAVGGSGEATLLAEHEGRNYSFRRNDPTDPDTQGYPSVLMAMDAGTGDLLFSLLIPDMDTAVSCTILEDRMALVGTMEDVVVVRTYDLTQEEPAELLVESLPGAYVDDKMFQQTLTIVTRGGSDEELFCEVVDLPGAVSSESCIVTVVDMVDGVEMTQKAFFGADGDMALYNLNIYLDYAGEATDESDGRYYVQIKLGGMDIELGTVS